LHISSRKSGGARFDSIEILRKDHGKPLSNFLGLGDFFVLALRMFNEPDLSATSPLERAIGMSRSAIASTCCLGKRPSAP
jgi:hypothetical protein